MGKKNCGGEFFQGADAESGPGPAGIPVGYAPANVFLA